MSNRLGAWWVLGCAALALTALSACRATEFRGSSTFNGGPQACYRRCAAETMQMASFVYMGEFATGCVCELIPARRTAGAEEPRGTGGEGIAAVAGVWQQMLEEERRRATR
jgi:hypothetical protein